MILYDPGLLVTERQVGASWVTMQNATAAITQQYDVSENGVLLLSTTTCVLTMSWRESVDPPSAGWSMATVVRVTYDGTIVFLGRVDEITYSYTTGGAARHGETRTVTRNLSCVDWLSAALAVEETFDALPAEMATVRLARWVPDIDLGPATDLMVAPLPAGADSRLNLIRAFSEAVRFPVRCLGGSTSIECFDVNDSGLVLFDSSDAVTLYSQASYKHSAGAVVFSPGDDETSGTATPAADDTTILAAGFRVPLMLPDPLSSQAPVCRWSQTFTTTGYASSVDFAYAVPAAPDPWELGVPARQPTRPGAAPTRKPTAARPRPVIPDVGVSAGGTSLPGGGDQGQVLTKSSGADQDVFWTDTTAIYTGDGTYWQYVDWLTDELSDYNPMFSRWLPAGSAWLIELWLYIQGQDSAPSVDFFVAGTPDTRVAGTAVLAQLGETNSQALVKVSPGTLDTTPGVSPAYMSNHVTFDIVDSPALVRMDLFCHDNGDGSALTVWADVTSGTISGVWRLARFRQLSSFNPGDPSVPVGPPPAAVHYASILWTAVYGDGEVFAGSYLLGIDPSFYYPRTANDESWDDPAHPLLGYRFYDTSSGDAVEYGVTTPVAQSTALGGDVTTTYTRYNFTDMAEPPGGPVQIDIKITTVLYDTPDPGSTWYVHDMSVYEEVVVG